MDDGSMILDRRFVTKVSCKFDFRRMPFDTQTCKVTAGFYADAVSEVRLKVFLKVCLQVCLQVCYRLPNPSPLRDC